MCQSFGAGGIYGSMLFLHFCEIGIHEHTMKSACSTQDSQPDGEIVQSQGQKYAMIFLNVPHLYCRKITLIKYTRSL